MVSVLVVDDEPSIRKLLRLTLERTHSVIEARDGEEGLRKLFLHRPDVMLLDVGMPILNGLAVCRAVRAEPLFDQIGIIILSANTSKTEAEEAGADRHVPKPFRPLQLLPAIDEVVALRQSGTRPGEQPGGARIQDAR